MFTTKPILFCITVEIYYSDEYMDVLVNGPRAANLNLNYEPKKQIINAEKFFKEDNCVICLTNPPNILFCNCGHLCVCEECSKTGESLENCPICKTKNTNLRIIEYKYFSYYPRKNILFISYNAIMLRYLSVPPVYTFYHHQSITLFY